MNDDERTERLSTLLDRNGHWIQSADTKANVFLALATAFVGFIMEPLVDGGGAALDLLRGSTTWGVVAAALYALAVLALVTSLGKCVWHAIRTVEARTTRPHYHGHIFFGDQAKMRLGTLERELLSMDTAELHRQYVEQIHTTAEIAVKKYDHLRSCVRWLRYGILSWSVVYAFSLAIK